MQYLRLTILYSSGIEKVFDLEPKTGERLNEELFKKLVAEFDKELFIPGFENKNCFLAAMNGNNRAFIFSTRNIDAVNYSIVEY